MSSNRTVSIIIVALLHVVLGYALITGLAANVVKKAVEDLQTFDVEEEPPPPEEEPPPPPENIPESPPPVVTPPPLVRTNTPPPDVTTTTIIPDSAPVTNTAPRVDPGPPAPATRVCPDGSVILATASCPAVKVQPAKARANLASYFSDDDYPQDAIRNEQQGTTGVRLEIGPDGRVTGCTVTSSSGSSSLDNTTCRLLRSRARFTPATDSSGQRTSDTTTTRIVWRLPEE